MIQNGYRRVNSAPAKAPVSFLRPPGTYSLLNRVSIIDGTCHKTHPNAFGGDRPSILHGDCLIGGAGLYVRFG